MPRDEDMWELYNEPLRSYAIAAVRLTCGDVISVTEYGTPKFNGADYEGEPPGITTLLRQILDRRIDCVCGKKEQVVLNADVRGWGLTRECP